MSIKAIIIEDEKSSRIVLKSYINRYFPDVIVESEQDTVEGAINYLQNHSPDIIFLDIQLRDGIGLDIFERINSENQRIIFTTANSEYTLKAFELKAFGYLLKPFSPVDFKKIMNRIIKDISYADISQNKIKVNVKQGIVYLNPQDIIRCESQSNYTEIFCKSSHKPFVIAKTLKMVESILTSSHFFFRIHQSHLVNFSYITKPIIKNNSIELITGEFLPISKSRKSDFTEFLGRLS